ncbi:MAG: sulfate adenylyltransferase subunit 1 (EFTu-like GTPase family), partial [Rickettsiales bacterium]
DLAEYSEERFLEIKKDYLARVESLDINSVNFIPISAINGDNVVETGSNMSWYQGKNMLDYLIDLEQFIEQKQGFRLAIQQVLKDDLAKKRFYQGTITSGEVSVGDEIAIYPSAKKAKVLEIIHSSKPAQKAKEEDSISLVLDSDIDIDRGSIFSGLDCLPKFDSKITADLIWFGDEVFDSNDQKELLVKINHNLVSARISKVNHLINIDDLSKFDAKSIEQNQVANVSIELSKSVAFDSFVKNKFTGSFLLIDKNSNETLACGLIEDLNKKSDEKTKKKLIDKILFVAKKFFR